MLVEIFFKALAALILTVLGSLWIDRLYRSCDELTFPEKIFDRAKFRRPILFCALTFFFAMTDDLFLSAAIFLLALMTATDFEQYMLFDAMTISLAALGAARIFFCGMNVVDYLVASIIGGGIFLLVAILSRGGLGGGDVKLIAALGLWLGEKLLTVVLLATVVGGLVALLMILLDKKNRGSYFAYGPYFAIAAIHALLTS